MSTVTRKIGFSDYDSSLGVNVCMDSSTGKWVVVTDEDTDELLADDLTPEAARSLAGLLNAAADECEKLNKVEAPKQATRFFRSTNNNVGKLEWRVTPDGEISCREMGAVTWLKSGYGTVKEILKDYRNPIEFNYGEDK